MIPLGLLYNRGTVSQKVQVIFKTYDKSKDGVLYTTTLKRIIRDFIQIAVIMVPELVSQNHLIKAQDAFGDQV